MTCTHRMRMNAAKKFKTCEWVWWFFRFSFVHGSFAPSSVADERVSSKWLYEFIASEWSQWLPETAMATLRKGGYYTLLVRKGLRVIALNNNHCFTFNVSVKRESHYSLCMKIVCVSLISDGTCTDRTRCASNCSGCTTLWAKRSNRMNSFTLLAMCRRIRPVACSPGIVNIVKLFCVSRTSSAANFSGTRTVTNSVFSMRPKTMAMTLIMGRRWTLHGLAEVEHRSSDWIRIIAFTTRSRKHLYDIYIFHTNKSAHKSKMIPPPPRSFHFIYWKFFFLLLRFHSISGSIHFLVVHFCLAFLSNRKLSIMKRGFSIWRRRMRTQTNHRNGSRNIHSKMPTICQIWVRSRWARWWTTGAATHRRSIKWVVFATHCGYFISLVDFTIWLDSFGDIKSSNRTSRWPKDAMNNAVWDHSRKSHRKSKIISSESAERTNHTKTYWTRFEFWLCWYIIYFLFCTEINEWWLRIQSVPFFLPSFVFIFHTIFTTMKQSVCLRLVHFFLG